MTKIVSKSENSIENAKVMVKRYKYYTTNTTGYIKEGDGLVFVTVVSNTFDFKSGEVTTVLEDIKGNLYRRTNFTSLYRGKEAYEGNDPASPSVWQTPELLHKADNKHLCGCNVKTVHDEDGDTDWCYLTVWVFDNGEAVEVPAVINKIAYERYRGWRLVDGSLPDLFWESRKDAYAFNEYKITDEEGEEFVEEGYMKRLMLTPEQWEIIHHMQNLCKKAKEANIKFFFDRDYCGTIKAMNLNNVEDLGYETQSEHGGDVIKFNEVIFADTELSVFDYNGDEDYKVALNPTPRQKKVWLKSHPENA